MPESVVNSLFSELLPWLIAFFVLSVAAGAFKYLLLPKLKGIAGEAAVNLLIGSKLDSGLYRLIKDIMLPTVSGTTQIDHVVVSVYGIFVIETKNYKGWIYGSEKAKQWTQVIYRVKNRFQNPLRQNYGHIKALSELTGIPYEYFHSVVVFVGDSEFKTEMPDNVVHAGQLARYVKGFTEAVINEAQIEDIVDTIGAWEGTLTKEQRRAHVKNLRKERAPVQADSAAPSCPRCSQEMVLRQNKKTQEEFWGCSDYPKCRGTRKVTR